MIRLTRVVGFLLMAAGALVVLAYLIKPLRFIWPLLRALPWPIQVGLAAAALGFVLLLGSLIWERMEQREQDRSLRDDL